MLQIQQIEQNICQFQNSAKVFLRFRSEIQQTIAEDMPKILAIRLRTSEEAVAILPLYKHLRSLKKILRESAPLSSDLLALWDFAQKCERHIAYELFLNPEEGTSVEQEEAKKQSLSDEYLDWMDDEMNIYDALYNPKFTKNGKV